MGLVTWPIKGVVSLARVIQRRVEEEQRDPVAARQELEEAERARAAGEISASEEAEVQQDVVDRMTREQP